MDRARGAWPPPPPPLAQVTRRTSTSLVCAQMAFSFKSPLGDKCLLYFYFVHLVCMIFSWANFLSSAFVHLCLSRCYFANLKIGDRAGLECLIFWLYFDCWSTRLIGIRDGGAEERKKRSSFTSPLCVPNPNATEKAQNNKLLSPTAYNNKGSKFDELGGGLAFF